MKIKTVAPIHTSKGNIGKYCVFSIIGINKIAPAGGNNVLTLSKVTNNTQQARVAQMLNGKCKYKFSPSLNIQPVAEANVIRPIMWKGLLRRGLLGFENSAKVTINGGARKYIW